MDPSRGKKRKGLTSFSVKNRESSFRKGKERRGGGVRKVDRTLRTRNCFAGAAGGSNAVCSMMKRPPQEETIDPALALGFGCVVVVEVSLMYTWLLLTLSLSLLSYPPFSLLAFAVPAAVVVSLLLFYRVVGPSSLWEPSF